eukprot:7411930-Pyramimonas_sp.AAC.1
MTTTITTTTTTKMAERRPMTDNRRPMTDERRPTTDDGRLTTDDDDGDANDGGPEEKRDATPLPPPSGAQRRSKDG